MAKGSMERRVERLEKEISGEGLEGDLFNYDGHQVEAKILRLPTKESCGVAIMPDDSKREIAATANMLDIIMDRRRQAESETDSPQPKAPLSEAELEAKREEYRDLLFIRTDGHVGIMEKLCSKHAGRKSERSEV